jgi:hypothetical protein
MVTSSELMVCSSARAHQGGESVPRTASALPAETVAKRCFRRNRHSRRIDELHCHLSPRLFQPREKTDMKYIDRIGTNTALWRGRGNH